MGNLLRRVRQFFAESKAHADYAERSCKHDGSDPVCMRCDQEAVGW